MHTSACRSNIKVGEILQVRYKGKAELAGHVKYKGWPEGIRSNIMVGQSLQVKYKGRLQFAARGGVLFFQCTGPLQSHRGGHTTVMIHAEYFVCMHLILKGQVFTGFTQICGHC